MTPRSRCPAQLSGGRQPVRSTRSLDCSRVRGPGCAPPPSPSVTPATSVPQGCKPQALPRKPLAAQTTCSVPRSLSLRGPPDPTEPAPPPAWHVTAVRTSHTLLCSAPRPRPPSSTSVLCLPLWEAWALRRAIGQGWPREGPFSQTVQTHPRGGWWASPTLGWARKVRGPRPTRQGGLHGLSSACAQHHPQLRVEDGHPKCSIAGWRPRLTAAPAGEVWYCSCRVTRGSGREGGGSPGCEGVEAPEPWSQP